MSNDASTYVGPPPPADPAPNFPRWMYNATLAPVLAETLVQQNALQAAGWTTTYQPPANVSVPVATPNYLGAFQTLVALTAQYPPGNVPAGWTAYTVDKGSVQNNGTTWSPVAVASASGNQLLLSAQPGIDPTGLTDSRAGLAAAMASVAGTNNTLVIDCPCLITIGTDLTKTIFVAGGTNLTFTASGAFITDSTGIPVFAWIGINASNCTWQNYTLRYIGNPGAVMLQGTGAWYGNTSNWNAVTLTNWLIANNGNTFPNQGGTAIWASPTNTVALHYISGQVSNINFIGSCSATAVYATADRFIPTLFSLGINWLYGLTVPNSTPINSSTAAQPSNISFDGFTVDGCYMGWVGTGANTKLRNITSLRYGDLEDASGNNQGGIGTVSARSGNLATDLWFAPPHLIYLQNSSASNLICSADYSNLLDEGIYTSSNPNYGSRRCCGSGFINMLKVDASSLNTVKDVICKRPDGFCDILGQVGSGFTPGCIMENISIFMDCGIGATVTTVNAASLPATTTSFTVLPANWVSNQTGGTYGGIPTGTYTTQFSSGEIRPVTYTVTVVSGNATAISASWTQPLLNANTNVVRIAPSTGPAVSGTFAFRWPGTPASNFWLNNIKILDQAAFPLRWPLQSDASVGHVNIFFQYELTVQDWPTIATYAPGFGLTGEGINIRGKTIFTNCSALQNYRGPIKNDSPFPTVDHYREEELHGWRQIQVTFTAPPSGTGGNILTAQWQTGVTGWIQPSGTCTLIFSTGERREATFTNGSAAVSWTGALVSSPTVNAQVCLINAAGFVAYRPRVQLALTGQYFNFGVRCRVIDVSNGIEINVNQGLMEETWTQFWQGIPTGATSITYDSSWAIDMAGFGVTVAVSGGTATAVNLTTGGNTILSGASLTASPSPPLPVIGPQPYAGAITIAAVSGTLPTAGTAYVGVRGRRAGMSTN